MSEEDTTILGGLGDAAGAAWDAVENVASAGYDAASGVVSHVEGMGNMLAATGDELIGDYAARDERDARSEENRAEGNQSWDQAGEDLQNAADDVY